MPFSGHAPGLYKEVYVEKKSKKVLKWEKGRNMAGCFREGKPHHLLGNLPRGEISCYTDKAANLNSFATKRVVNDPNRTKEKIPRTKAKTIEKQWTKEKYCSRNQKVCHVYF